MLIKSFKDDLINDIQENTPVVLDQEEVNATPTVGFQRVLQRAVYHAQSAEKRTVYAMNVLVAIFAEKESYALYLLQLNDIQKMDVLEHISNVSNVESSETNKDGSTKQTKEKAGMLTQYTTNLNELAKKGGIDPLLGREKELMKAVQVLARRRKKQSVIYRVFQE